MIPLFKVGMSSKAINHVSEVLNSGYVGQGRFVDDFELKIMDYLRLEIPPVTVNSATSAIDLALELIGVGAGDEVISTPQTCFASNVHVIHRKATIRWADIDPITGLIEYDSVKKLITPKTKCIIAVNWGGRFADYSKLKSFGIPVIEDAAHNWDTHISVKIPRGDFIAYSFQAIKFLTTVDGGILVVPKVHDVRARMLRWYGLDRTSGQSFRCTQDITEVGYKYHMNNLNAAIGIANIEFASKSVEVSRSNSMFLYKNIKNELITVPEYDELSSYWLFSIHVKNNLKDNFISYMADNGIEVSPVHFRNDYYSSTLKFREGELIGVDSFTDTQVCIPNGFWLTDDDLTYITTIVNNFK
jgi:dTDP-4-amino-4,6-dideoxygalactose transaminase